MTQTYKIGDRVRVEFEGLVTCTDVTFLGRFGHSVEVTRSNGYRHSVKPEDVKEVLGPENWPPQIGDIWEADGTEYFIRRNTVEEDEVVIVPDYDSVSAIYTDEIDYFKSLKPTLVRRKSQ